MLVQRRVPELQRPLRPGAVAAAGLGTALERPLAARPAASAHLAAPVCPLLHSTGWRLAPPDALPTPFTHSLTHTALILTLPRRNLLKFQFCLLAALCSRYCSLALTDS